MSRRHHLSDALAMTDRERLLTTIMMRVGPFMEDARHGRSEPTFGVYWADPKPGDLVKCETQRTPSKWAWAWYEEHGEHANDKHCWGRHGHACYLLRELGGESLIHMGNESLIALRGFGADELLEGQQFRFYVKVLKAFGRLGKRYGSQSMLYAGVVWPDRHSKRATIGIRPHAFSSPTIEGDYSRGNRTIVKPIPVVLEHNSRTRIRDIVEALKDVGKIDWQEHALEVSGRGGLMTAPLVAL